MSSTLTICIVSYILVGFVWSCLAITDYYYRGQKFSLFWETFNFGFNMFMFPLGVITGKFAYISAKAEECTSETVIKYTLIVIDISRSVFHETCEACENNKNDENSGKSE